MLYHYTSFDALGKILLHEPEKGKEICFRATRYDCFEDQTEFQYGIDRTKELMEEIEKNEFAQKYKLTSDHFIAKHFDSKIIFLNSAIPKPFVISLTNTPASKKMWRKYGQKGDGVVMEFDFNPETIEWITKVMGQSITRLDNCLYYTPKQHEKIKNLLKECYFECAYATAPIGLGYSDTWLKFIWATILCSFCARIKDGKKYSKERETRIILNIPGNEWENSFKKLAKITQTDLEPFYLSLRNHFNLNGKIPATLEEMLQFIRDIKSYQRENKEIFFKEFFLPILSLKSLWVKKRDVKTVQELIKERGYNIPVNKVKSSFIW